MWTRMILHTRFDEEAKRQLISCKRCIRYSKLGVDWWSRWRRTNGSIFSLFLLYPFFPPFSTSPTWHRSGNIVNIFLNLFLSLCRLLSLSSIRFLLQGADSFWDICTRLLFHSVRLVSIVYFRCMQLCPSLNLDK